MPVYVKHIACTYFIHIPTAEGVREQETVEAFVDSMQSYFKSNGKTREFAAHSSKVHSVAWNCDGRKLASGSYDKTVNVFHLERDRLVSEMIFFLDKCTSWKN